MDMKKEFEQWLANESSVIMADNPYAAFEAWQAAHQRFADFIEQAIHDSACAEERQTLQRLLEDFKDNLEADKRKGQKRVAVNLEDL